MATYAQVLSSLALDRDMSMYDAIRRLYEEITCCETRIGEDPVEMGIYIRDNIDRVIDLFKMETLIGEAGNLVQSDQNDQCLP